MVPHFPPSPLTAMVLIYIYLGTCVCVLLCFDKEKFNEDRNKNNACSLCPSSHDCICPLVATCPTLWEPLHYTVLLQPCYLFYSAACQPVKLKPWNPWCELQLSLRFTWLASIKKTAYGYNMHFRTTTIRLSSFKCRIIASCIFICSRTSVTKHLQNCLKARLCSFWKKEVL